MPTFRGITKEEAFRTFGFMINDYIDRDDGDFIPGNQFSLANRDGYVPAPIGNESSWIIDVEYNKLESRGERIIANLLNLNGISYQHPFQWDLKPELREKIPKSLIQRTYWNNDGPKTLLMDFYLKKIPKTIIEFCGLAGNPGYDARMDVKGWYALQEGIKLIMVYPEEVNNTYLLKQKLESALGLNLKC